MKCMNIQFIKISGENFRYWKWNINFKVVLRCHLIHIILRNGIYKTIKTCIVLLSLQSIFNSDPTLNSFHVTSHMIGILRMKELTSKHFIIDAWFEMNLLPSHHTHSQVSYFTLNWTYMIIRSAWCIVINIKSYKMENCYPKSVTIKLSKFCVTWMRMNLNGNFWIKFSA